MSKLTLTPRYALPNLLPFTYDNVSSHMTYIKHSIEVLQQETKSTHSQCLNLALGVFRPLPNETAMAIAQAVDPTTRTQILDLRNKLVIQMQTIRDYLEDFSCTEWILAPINERTVDWEDLFYDLTRYIEGNPVGLGHWGSAIPYHYLNCSRATIVIMQRWPTFKLEVEKGLVRIRKGLERCTDVVRAVEQAVVIAEEMADGWEGVSGVDGGEAGGTVDTKAGNDEKGDDEWTIVERNEAGLEGDEWEKIC